MTTELSLERPYPPRCSYATRSHLHTSYTPPHPPPPLSSLSHALRPFGFVRVWPGLVPPVWPLDPLLDLLLFLPALPSVCETFRNLRFSVEWSEKNPTTPFLPLDSRNQESVHKSSSVGSIPVSPNRHGSTREQIIPPEPVRTCKLLIMTGSKKYIPDRWGKQPNPVWDSIYDQRKIPLHLFYHWIPETRNLYSLPRDTSSPSEKHVNSESTDTWTLESLIKTLERGAGNTKSRVGGERGDIKVTKCKKGFHPQHWVKSSLKRTKRDTKGHKDHTTVTSTELWKRQILHQPVRTRVDVLTRNGIRSISSLPLRWNMHNGRRVMWRCITLDGYGLLPLVPSRLTEQKIQQSYKVGRDEKGMNSNRPDLVVLWECLETHQDHENLLYLTKRETTHQTINKQIGEGKKLSLEKTEDVDVLWVIVMKLQKRAKERMWTLLIKVIGYRSTNGRRSIGLNPGHSPPKNQCGLRQSTTGGDRNGWNPVLSNIGEGSGKVVQRTHPTKRKMRHLWKRSRATGRQRQMVGYKTSLLKEWYESTKRQRINEDD